MISIECNGWRELHILTWGGVVNLEATVNMLILLEMGKGLSRKICIYSEQHL